MIMNGNLMYYKVFASLEMNNLLSMQATPNNVREKKPRKCRGLVTNNLAKVHFAKITFSGLLETLVGFQILSVHLSSLTIYDK